MNKPYIDEQYEHYHKLTGKNPVAAAILTFARVLQWNLDPEHLGHELNLSLKDVFEHATVSVHADAGVEFQNELDVAVGGSLEVTKES